MTWRKASSEAVEQHFSYDDEHRVSEVRFDGYKEFSRVEYHYDAVGRRTRKILHRHGRETETITFIWSGLRMVGESSSLTPERNTQYIYSENSREPLARVDSIGEQSETFWYHTELNGLPERMTDAHGEVVWRDRFSTWGETERESVTGFQTVPQNLRFQGQYLNRETDLHYNLFRYYDPDAGRFTQVDPGGLAGGLNTYAYAPNALNWIDPLGLSKCEAGFLYRGDKRAPNVIFREGFKPLGDSMDLLLHAKDNRSPPNNFISTSSDIGVAQNFAARDELKGFVYAIRQQSNGIDVNKTLGKNTPFPDEVEIAISGGISNKDILGVTPVNSDGSFVGFSFMNFLRYSDANYKSKSNL